jgi:hypothetical protein
VDNLNEKEMSKPTQCCFCNDNESISHLFFECAIIKVVWGFVGEYLGFDLGSNYISVASKWLQKEIFDFVNIISTVVLKGIWLTRNDFVFNKHVWLDVKCILRRIWKLTMEWRIIRKETKNGRDDEMIIFFGEGDPRAVEDRKHIKIILVNNRNEMLEAGTFVQSC